MSNDQIIQVKNLSCMSGSQCLLHDINWRVKKGEQWVVFGRNGCGKTTLLSIIAGYKGYQEGNLAIFNQHYSNKTILDLHKKIGWVSSSFFDQYYHQECVLDIVLSSLFGTLGIQFEVSNQDIKKAKTLLTRLGLKDKMDAPFNLLSKGERQQVLIARAFMTSCEILILDEPCTGLDVLAREKLLLTIKELVAETQITVIYVTHYMEEVLPIFENCLLLRKGSVYRIGKTKEIFITEVMSDFFDEPITIKYQNDKYILTNVKKPESFLTNIYD